MPHSTQLPFFVDEFGDRPRPSGQCPDLGCDLTRDGCTARRSSDLEWWTCGNSECAGDKLHPRVQPATRRQVRRKSAFAKHAREGRQSWCDDCRARSNERHSGGERDHEALARKMARLANAVDGCVCWTYELIVITGRAFPNLVYVGWTSKPPELRKQEHLRDSVNVKMAEALGSVASHADTQVQIVGSWRHNTAAEGALHERDLYRSVSADLPDGWEMGNAGEPHGTAEHDHQVVKAIRAAGLSPHGRTTVEEAA